MENLNWKDLQEQSDLILSDGLYTLINQPFYNLPDIKENYTGNYLISLGKTPHYIGEAKDVYKRIKQQSKPLTSTFYKNYQKAIRNQIASSIEAFQIQFMPTNIGRKEIEEFGIVNLKCSLNKFQLNKRIHHIVSSQKGIWGKIQNSWDILLYEAEGEIMKYPAISWFKLNTFSDAGLYLIKDKRNEIIYIGESSNIKERITTHSRQTYFSALRRHIGTDILGYELQERKNKKRYFSDLEDKCISNYLENCKAILYPISLGRYELEEYLIKKHKPLLNRKDNKDS